MYLRQQLDLKQIPYLREFILTVFLYSSERNFLFQNAYPFFRMEDLNDEYIGVDYCRQTNIAAKSTKIKTTR